MLTPNTLHKTRFCPLYYFQGSCQFLFACRCRSARSQGNFSLPMCEYAPSPYAKFWTRLTVRLDLCARLFSMPTALALPCMLYALTRIVGYPRHEVRNEDRLPFVQRFRLKTDA